MVGFLSLGYEKLVKVLSSFKLINEENGEVSDELKGSLDVLDLELTIQEIITAEKNILILSLIFFIATTISLALVGFNPFLPLILTASVPLASAHLISEYPKLKAKEMVLNSLSTAPEIISILAASLKQNPNLEEAISFLSEEKGGLIVKDFKKALKKCWMGEAENLEEQLPEIGYKWGHYLPGFKRSLYLIRSALSEQRKEKRDRLLDKAIERTLDSVSREVEEFASKLSTPTMILFSFGTVIPLAFISLFPIITFIGESLTSLQISIGLVLTLVGTYFYSNNILQKRPIAFPPPEIPSKEKFELLGKELRIKPIFYAMGLCLLISIPGIFFLIGKLPIFNFTGTVYDLLENINTLTMVWGVGIGISVYYFTKYNELSKVRNKVKRLEETILDGLYQLANKIDLNKSIESSIREISEMMKRTATGELFREISNQLRSGESLEKSIKDSLSKIKSKTTRSLFNFFLKAYQKGSKSATQSLFTITNYFERVKETEQNIRNHLRKSLSMMEISAVFLIPMITGLTVTLQELLQEGIEKMKGKMVASNKLGIDLLGFQGMDPSLLQLILGFYMLAITYLLIRYCVYIRNGEDRIKLGLEISRKIPISLVVFSATLLISKFLLL